MTQNRTSKIRTTEEANRLKFALIPVDRAYFESETKWGVGRLERLVAPSILMAYRRGWDAWRVALDEGDADAVEALGPKMIVALGVMDRDATAAGHQPLDPVTWETPLRDGSVLVLVRSNAEAAAVMRSTNGKAFQGAPGGGTGVVAEEGSTETGLPLDVIPTIRSQHEGRRLVCWTLAEVARLIEKHGSALDQGRSWEGEAVQTGVLMDEGAAAELARSGYPLPAEIATDIAPVAKPPVAELDF
jgi:hypothetical protein